MPRIKYSEYKPKADAAAVVGQADAILLEYAQQGFNLTLRQLYYQFIARDLFPAAWVNDKGTKNHDGNYNKLKTIISRAREAGMLDWDHIKDRGRELEIRSHWVSGRQFLDSVTPQFHIDLWNDQPKRVEVWVEKDALSDVINKACYPLDVPNFACKGYTSASSIWEAAHNRFLRTYHKAGQETVIIHLGDHDPSGVHMTEDIETRLDLFSTPMKGNRNGRPDITVERIALNMSQIEEFEPPPSPTKEADPRSADYIAEFGETCWELDALEPAMLVRLIRDRIERHLDRSLFDARRKYAATERRRLIAIARHWYEMVEALPAGAEADVDLEDDGADPLPAEE